MSGEELELVETYEVLGERRFRFRLKGTNVYVNVTASNEKEAIERARDYLRRLRIREILRETNESQQPQTGT
ncbi:MAG: hypothetical protein ABWW70_07985 [Thermoproteota archaeon]